MTKTTRNLLAILLFLAVSVLPVAAQRKFFNLTASDVKIDSVLPVVSYIMPLSANYADSLYTVTIDYPEFIDATSADIAAYNRLSGAPLPEMPVSVQTVALTRKQPSLSVTFCPLVFRDGRYRILVSFMLRVQSTPLKRAQRRLLAKSRTTVQERYAAHSVLASGRWAKISVPESGIYQLTEALVRKAGFSDLSKVKVYGYGGNLQNERFDGAELAATDDLQEVPTCIVNGRRLFYAKGPVSWSSNTATVRTRNYYSSVGCYFITQGEDTPVTVDSAAFVESFYPSSPDFYHDLHEVDNFAWLPGGRNLFENTPVTSGNSKSYIIKTPVGDRFKAADTRLYVRVSAGEATTVAWKHNGKEYAPITTPRLGEYDKGGAASADALVALSGTGSDTVTITNAGGGTVRLDFISFTYVSPKPLPDLRTATFAVPDYVYNITNQDHHADTNVDMVIIIPTSQKLLPQAQRLKAFHEAHDSLSVRIVPADELFNEFSCGTPDAAAYRRYLKMMYDRASTAAEMPKYLLLFGDGMWDNRMLTPECRNLNPDDHLLCFESENSFNKVTCYVDDGWFGLLDDGEGVNLEEADRLDIGVGRFPVSNAEDAKIMVDKTINYATNANAGAWQNTLMFMGDDGNGNLHMEDANDAAEDVAARYPGYLVKKVMWDAYKRESSSTGKTYPEVAKIIKQQQAAGALIMDYAGHGSEVQISHESVLRITDFAQFTNTNLPLWITASCDIMPFDGTQATIGETALLNPKGGAVAFYGTTRTVYAYYNKLINMAFLKYVLSKPGGKPMTLGEAQRLARNELISTGKDLTSNKLQYALLGDPALSLNLPMAQVVVDSINGVPVSSAALPRLGAGAVARISGHVESVKPFDGVVTATVRDTKELITCRLNDTSKDGASVPFTYYDRTKTLYQGADNVRAGRFSLSFAVPKDINYADGTGLLNLYALSADKSVRAHGECERFEVGAGGQTVNDSIGPSIYCYLNSPSFVNGGNVNTAPFFVAEVSDRDGINAAGSGIGHDLQLIVDGSMEMTYNLNGNFTFDFGSYTSGSTRYALPELAPGPHRLLFRAWDVLNNSSTAELTFNVVKGLEPTLFSVGTTKNPATTSTTFILNHDRTGSKMDVEIEVFDTSGRLLWRHDETGVSTSSAYTVDWDLTVDGGHRLHTGVYIYRARISADGSAKVSKAKKLIVLGNN